MKVSEIMTPGVEVAGPHDPIAQAARMMRDREIGFLPVVDDGKLVGSVTDRDIVIRGIAHDRGPNTPVREVMTQEVHCCFDDEDIEDAADKMSECQVRRLPVLNRQMKLLGVISLGDVAQANDDTAGNTLEQVTEAGGAHAH